MVLITKPTDKYNDFCQNILLVEIKKEWNIHPRTVVHSLMLRPDRFSRTDLIFLCVFPVLFLLFNVFYWTAIYWWRWHNWTRIDAG